MCALKDFVIEVGLLAVTENLLSLLWNDIDVENVIFDILIFCFALL